MSDLYPFLLVPDFRERVWGARDLSPIYSYPATKEPIGEVWLTGDECKVANGPLRGTALSELCRRYQRELVGEAAADGTRFPLLVKFLFPREKLSVQVHPDDDGARRLGQPCGKTECWYVLRAEPGAQIGLGLKPGTNRARMQQAIEQAHAEELLNWITIKAGEMIYVAAGTVHAIGPGSILVETQQNSDTTYRLYDYGRPRELHVREGLEAAKERTAAGKVQPRQTNGKDHVTLVSSPCFVVDKFALEKEERFAARSGERSSAQILVALDGCGVVQTQGREAVTFARGEAVVVPARIKEFQVRPQWKVEFLRAMLPGRKLPEPATCI